MMALDSPGKIIEHMFEIVKGVFRSLVMPADLRSAVSSCVFEKQIAGTLGITSNANFRTNLRFPSVDCLSWAMPLRP